MDLQTNFLYTIFKSERSAGLILLICVIISLALANSGIGDDYSTFLNYKLGPDSIHLSYSISSWINDGLMAVFFLLVGLEIKREIVAGELSTTKNAMLPVVAALGGMIVPALIYLIFNHSSGSVSGWGIPMATDIAFALAIIALLGKNVPLSLKIFLAALAIADDLGAILVIAIFYTSQIHWIYLGIAGGMVLLLLAFNYLKVRSFYFYLIPGLLLWYAIHHSGIHATIAGVLLAFTIPMDKNVLRSPVHLWEHRLKIPVNFLIMPVFALANTNIRLESEMIAGLYSPIGLGIFFGLLFGKSIGITVFSWIAIKLNLAQLPSEVNWKHMAGVGVLAGIGFTMSIFISLLSFGDANSISTAKFAILCTSIIAGLAGFSYLKFIARSPNTLKKA